MKQTIEEVADRIVRNEVLVCFSYAFGQIARQAEHFPDDQDAIYSLASGRASWECNGCAESGSDEDEAEEACTCKEDADLFEANNEPLEYWLVSKWFSYKLKAEGECVEDLFDLTIWGRTISGQMISMDSVIQTIAKELAR